MMSIDEMDKVRNCGLFISMNVHVLQVWKVKIIKKWANINDEP